MSFVMILAGPSCAGKSSVAAYLHANIPFCKLVHQDDYYKALEELPRAGVHGEVEDWDVLDSLCTRDLLLAVEKVIKEGETKIESGSKQKAAAQPIFML